MQRVAMSLIDIEATNLSQAQPIRRCFHGEARRMMDQPNVSITLATHGAFLIADPGRFFRQVERVATDYMKGAGKARRVAGSVVD